MNPFQHILFVTTEYFTPDQPQTGGLGHYMFKVARNLTERGIKVSIIHIDGRSASIHDTDKFRYISFSPEPFQATFFQYSIHQLSRFFLKYSYLHFCKLKDRSRQIRTFVERFLHEHQPDLVQYSNLGGIAFELPDEIPTVIRLSSHTGLYNLLGKGYYGLDPQKVNAQEKIEALSYQKPTALLSPSQAMLKAAGPYKRQMQVVIESPAFEYPMDSDSTLSGDYLTKPFLLFFGSVDYRKGVDLLLRAFKTLGTSDVNLVLVGRCQEDCEVNTLISKQLKEQRIPGVYYPGSMNKQQLNNLIRSALAVVLPSRVDNFPNTLVEALQQGKIVIGPSNWGFEQVIENGVNGLLFESGHEQELLKAINQLLRLTDEQKKQMENAALQTAHLLHPDRIVPRMIQFYHDVIEFHTKLCAE